MNDASQEARGGLQLSPAATITHQVQQTLPPMRSVESATLAAQSPLPPLVSTQNSLSAMLPAVGAPPAIPPLPTIPASMNPDLVLRGIANTTCEGELPASTVLESASTVAAKSRRVRPSRRKTPMHEAVSSCSSNSSNSIVMLPPRMGAPKMSPAVMRQRQEDQIYTKKIYFLKRTIKALVFKNAALCDEVSRLNQRIFTVSEERKLLGKRWLHQEKNRLRRLQVQQKKAEARRAAAEKAAAVAESAVGVDESEEAVVTRPAKRSMRRTETV